MTSELRWNSISVEETPTYMPLIDTIAGSLTKETTSETWINQDGYNDLIYSVDITKSDASLSRVKGGWGYTVHG